MITSKYTICKSFGCTGEMEVATDDPENVILIVMYTFTAVATSMHALFLVGCGAVCLVGCGPVCAQDVSQDVYESTAVVCSRNRRTCMCSIHVFWSPLDEIFAPTWSGEGTCVASPTKKADSWNKSKDWKHPYLCVFLGTTFRIILL